MKKKYTFENVPACEMCGDSTTAHRILGQRLNQSQGLSPKNKTGISVSIKKCTNCNLIYSYPLPIPDDIMDHYGVVPEEYWKPSYFEIDPYYFSAQIRDLQKLMDVKQGMKALDIGAGLGKTIIVLNRIGFDTYGFEPSVNFHERAISKMGIAADRLKHGMIEEIEYDTEMFDFISFGAVFEHLYHPAQSLEKSITWLKAGGLVHIEVPSSNYFIGKLINFYYRLKGTTYVTNLSPMHSPYHLYEFGLTSFEKIAEKLNCEIVMHRYDVGNIMSIPSFLHPILKYYMKITNTGMQLTVYLKKKE
ncbi:MAG TPA: class I SAM-dependent methyltransferase [Cytophaga sp.]|jgi:ubiquinone/menaquinone biosynthesis C-methylase UbiE|nr:class I SAM-dependent methyltransferase [Cytophaga sp.]